MQPIRYIGVKPTKLDNVAGTGVTWNGPNDIQLVPDQAVPKLLLHPMVWELARAMPAEPKTEQEDPTKRTTTFTHVTEGEGSQFRLQDGDTGEVVDLGLMDEKDIKAFTRLNLIKADLRKKGDALRADVVAGAIEPIEG